MGLIQKAFGDIITFSRSSNATRIGPTGLVEYAPHNLLTYSEQFNDAAWATKSNGSVTTNAATAPDGAVTADAFINDTAASAHYIGRNITLTTVAHTFSVYVKAAGINWIALDIYDAASKLSYFNLATGSTGTNASGNTSTITAVGNGWYRCTVTRTMGTTGSAVAVYLATGDGVFSYTGNGTNGVYLWGAQLSVGSVPGDYTPTTSAAVYGPRFDFDPVTLAARGLLIEEQRTNLFTYSEDFSNAAWSKTGTTVVANAATAPDGQVTADEITFGTGTSALVQTKSGLSAGARYEPSVYIKRITTSGEIIIRNTEDGSYGRWAINLALLGSGWERITRSHAAVTITAEFVASPSGICAPAFYGSDSNIKAYLWGAQLE